MLEYSVEYLVDCRVLDYLTYTGCQGSQFGNFLKFSSKNFRRKFILIFHVHVRYMSSFVRPSVCLSVVCNVLHPTQAIDIFGNV